MKLLQDFAKDHRHMQFIFVTPNDCSMLPTSDFCRVQKMKPPVKDYGGLQRRPSTRTPGAWRPTEAAGRRQMWRVCFRPRVYFRGHLTKDSLTPKRTGTEDDPKDGRTCIFPRTW